MKAKGVMLIAVALVAWGLKRHYAESRPDDLWWILSPTTSLVGAVTGATFAVAPGEGYLSHERMFLIEKSCPGINFMIAAFGMVAFVLRHRCGTVFSGAGILGASLLAAYSTAVLVNAARIMIAMGLAARSVAWLTPADAHRLEGVVVYFGGLALLHEVVQRLDRGAPVAGRHP